MIKYEEGIIAGKKANLKRYYRYLSSKNPYPKNEMILKDGDKTETDPFSCGNILKKTFAAAFTDPRHTTVVPYQLPRRDAEITELNFSIASIERILRNLKTPKSPGPDQSSNILLKKFTRQFAPPLFLLFSKMHETGVIPKCFKEAIVIPIFKKGNKQDPNNYRPVSLTSCIMKVFEKIILDSMINFIDEHNILSPHQHGFFRKRSTATNLLNFWHDLTCLANQRSQVTVIYTDMSKAFDRIPHNFLVDKLDKMGFRGNILRLIKSYLSDRFQAVSVKGFLSDPMNVTSGTPQGGVLSGLLFALYINVLPGVVPNVHIYIYADDVKLMMPINSTVDVRMMQSQVNAQSAWCDAWGLPMNPDKCEFIHYVPRNHNSINPTYNIKGTPIKKASTVKDLGITISDDLKFNIHIENITKKTNREIGRARRSFKCRRPLFMADLYKTYICPNLEYCPQLWNQIHSTLALKIKKTQNRFTRLIPRGRNICF